MRVMTKAVFPVAGLGSRFLPATKASPKEMMPIVDKPLIQYAVEEAVAAGLTEMIFITGRHKRAIEDHFDKAYEIESELASRGKKELLDLVQGILPPNVNCIYIRQPEQLGLGHAVLCAKPVINDEPFAVILADDLIDGDPPVVQQMAEVFAREGRSVLGVQEVPRSQTGQLRHRALDPDRRPARVGRRHRREAAARGGPVDARGGRAVRSDPAHLSSPRSTRSPGPVARSSSPMRSRRCSARSESSPTASRAPATTADPSSGICRPPWRSGASTPRSGGSSAPGSRPAAVDASAWRHAPDLPLYSAR